MRRAGVLSGLRSLARHRPFERARPNTGMRRRPASLRTRAAPARRRIDRFSRPARPSPPTIHCPDLLRVPSAFRKDEGSSFEADGSTNLSRPTRSSPPTPLLADPTCAERRLPSGRTKTAPRRPKDRKDLAARRVFPADMRGLSAIVVPFAVLSRQELASYSWGLSCGCLPVAGCTADSG